MLTEHKQIAPGKLLAWAMRNPAACAMLLILAGIVCLVPGLFGGNIFAFNDISTNDLLYLHLPVQMAYGQALHHGRLLQWIPQIYSGFPIMDEGQGGFLYPPNVVLWGLLPPVAAMNATFIIHALIAGMGSYALARTMTGSDFAALPAAVAGALAGDLFGGHAHHPNIFIVVSLAPWMFYCAERYGQTSEFRYALTMGLVSGLAVLAGQPQYLIITMLGTYLFLTVRYLFSATDAPSIVRTRHLATFVCASIVIAVLVGSPQLYSTLLLYGYSYRAGVVGQSFTSDGTLPWHGIMTYIYPYYHGDVSNGTSPPDVASTFWEYYHYMGVSTALLAVAGMVAAFKRHPGVRSLAVLFFLSYMAALGTQTPVGLLLTHVPIIMTFREPSRWLCLADLAMLPPAAFGALWLCEKLTAITKSGTASLWSIAVLLALVVAADISATTRSQVPTMSPDFYFTPIRQTSLPQAPNETRLLTIGDEEAEMGAYERSKGWNGDRIPYVASAMMLPPNTAMERGVSDVIGYRGALVPRYVFAIWGDGTTNPGIIRSSGMMAPGPNGSLAPQPPFLRICAMWGVNTVKSIYPLGPPFKRVGSLAGIQTYSLPAAFPRAWVVERLLSVDAANDTAMVNALIEPGLDPRTEAIVAGPPPALPPDAHPGEAQILSDDDEAIAMRVDTPGVLVLRDTWYPRWSATVDGRPATIYRVNSSMRGVVVGRAGSIVRMTYRNPWLSPLTALSALTGLGIIVFALPGRQSAT